MGHTNRAYDDFKDFSAAKGERVAVKLVNGTILYGVITNFEYDKLTREVRMTIG